MWKQERGGDSRSVECLLFSLTPLPGEMRGGGGIRGGERRQHRHRPLTAAESRAALAAGAYTLPLFGSTKASSLG